MNGVCPPDPPPPVQTASSTSLAASSPLKGRTAHRRSRKIIRTGAHAIEEAKERASGTRLSPCRENSDNPPRRKIIIAGRKESAISSSRRRHKRRKSSGYVAPDESSGAANKTGSLGQQKSKPHSTEDHNLIDAEEPNSGDNDASAEGGKLFNDNSPSTTLEGNANLCYNGSGDGPHQMSSVKDCLKNFSDKQSINTSPEEAPTISLGGRGCCRDASTAQDIGNYRMLIDDLSYLCSAIIQCRMKPVQYGQGVDPTICKHTPITAGAACDIAELISHCGTRSTLLIAGAESSKSTCGKIEGTRVGALDAVLESIACAPPVLDFSVKCRKLIDGHSFLCQPETSSQQNRVKISSEDNGKYNPDGIRNLLCENNPSKNARHQPEVKGNDFVVQSGVEGRKYDAISTKALSIVSYFVGIDCTGSDRAAILSKGPRHRLAVHITRKSVLQHKSALQGIARLVADDPVVHAYLHVASRTCTDKNAAIDISIMTPGSQVNKVAPLQDAEQGPSAYCDPTKLGRRSRKKRSGLAPYFAGPSKQDIEPPLESLHGNHLKTEGVSYQPKSLSGNGRNHKKSRSFDFSPNGGSPSLKGEKRALNGSDKYEEKISLALSRVKLTSFKVGINLLPKCDLPLTCTFCNIWAPYMMSHVNQNSNPSGSISASSVALIAADCIITGKDKFSEKYNAADLRDDEEDIYFGTDSNDPNLEGVMSRNPIVFANEMLRQSGSLPYYSRSMSETLAAILLSSKSTYASSHNNGTKCSKCISYLQHRASSLSEVIDSLCCLSPNVSIILSLQESFLVPSLLRAIAELSFATEDNQSRFSCESTSIALKTLTSLTHENSVACEQIICPYRWKITLPAVSQGSTSSQITGLDIIFSYLFKTVSLKQGSNSEQCKSNYDNIVFCLNILTNIVEVVPNPTKSMIEAIVVYEDFLSDDSNLRISGLTWLARWVVSKTSGFQDSVMQGSFGAENDGKPAVDINELKAGEEDNLLTSGNGFVLLACLMIDDESFSSRSIRESIVKELPIDLDGNSGGIQFMIKTLKAFCNFYHYSVGDLSVAVIAPVVKLITGLEKIDLME